MATIATVEQVQRYLPKNLPDTITSAVIYDALEQAHAYYGRRLSPRAPSADDDLDVVIEVLLAAVEVRDEIPGLRDEDGSRTDKMEKRAEKMIQVVLDTIEASGARNPLPVGPDGRDGEGATVRPIFKVPRPSSDEYAGLDSDDPFRPGLRGV